MKYIEKFYGREHLDKLKGILSRKPESNRVVSCLVGTSEFARIWQEEFDKYLELAFRHNIIDKDLRSRLFSDEWKIFYQPHRELMCAYFIEKILNYKITFHPKGNKNSIGDFILGCSEKEQIFVEVKSPIRDEPINLQVRSGDDADVVKSKVRKARKQMPKDDRKNMVILAGDLGYGPTYEKISIIKALYGEPIVTWPIGDKGQPLSDSKLSIKPSGMFQPTFNTRIRAVAALEDFLGIPSDSSPIRVKYIFKIYHNPYANKNSIDKDAFKGWPQFVLNKKTNKLEWID